MNFVGFLAGLFTAILWAATAICFEQAGKRLGSLEVNTLRLFVALVFFGLLSLVRSGVFFVPCTPEEFFLLSASGLVGFVLGDLFLFQAFVLIGARLSMLVYASVPPLTALAAYFFLGEPLGLMGILGMIITLGGIMMAVLFRPNQDEAAPKDDSRKPGRAQSLKGVLLAFGGSLGQAAGLLLGKTGASRLDAFQATQYRVFAGLIGFSLVLFVSGKYKTLRPAFSSLLPRQKAESSDSEVSKHRKMYHLAFALLSLGAFLGPFLGVSLGLVSAQLIPTGLASTLMALVPVILIPVSALLFHEKIGFGEIVGTIIAILGVPFLLMA